MHYFAIVLVPPDTADIPSEVDRIMAPHQERWDENDGEPEGWWDYWVIGGSWSDRIPGNVTPVRDLSERSFYRLVLPDGRTEERCDWTSDTHDYGTGELENPRFREFVGRELVAHRDHLAVVVDYHC